MLHIESFSCNHCSLSVHSTHTDNTFTFTFLITHTVSQRTVTIHSNLPSIEHTFSSPIPHGLYEVSAQTPSGCFSLLTILPPLCVFPSSDVGVLLDGSLFNIDRHVVVTTNRVANKNNTTCRIDNLEISLDPSYFHLFSAPRKFGGNDYSFIALSHQSNNTILTSAHVVPLIQNHMYFTLPHQGVIIEPNHRTTCSIEPHTFKYKYTSQINQHRPVSLGAPIFGMVNGSPLLIGIHRAHRVGIPITHHFPHQWSTLKRKRIY